jgi:hypothetical protein
MRRRQCIAAASTVTAGTLAGCISGDTDDNTTENETDGGGDDSETGTENGGNESGNDSESDDENGEETAAARTAWLSWVPDAVVTDDTTVTVLDVRQVRRVFPEEVVDEFGLSLLAASLGIDESNIREFIFWERRGVDGGPTILTGDYDPEAVSDALETTEDGGETYRGFRVFERQFDDNVALSESAIVLADDVRQILDARERAVPAFGQSEAWQSLLESVEGPIVELSPGVLDAEDPTFAGAEKTAFGIGATEDGGMRLTGTYLFASEDRARESFQAIGGDDDDSDDDDDNDSALTLLHMELDGRRIIYIVETDGFGSLEGEDPTPLSATAD